MPQPALNVDMDALTNVESLSFSFDPTKGVLPVVFIQNQLTRVPIPIPIPNLNPLQPPLGLLPTPIANDQAAQGHGQADARWQAIKRGLAEAKKSQDAVSGAAAASTCCATAGCSRRGSWSACAAPGWPTTASTTSRASPARSSAASSSRASTLTRNGLISITPRVPV